MNDTRKARSELRRGQRRRLYTIIVTAVVVVAALVVAVVALTSRHGAPAPLEKQTLAESVTTSASAAPTSSASVEVPELIGQSVVAARTVLSAAGLEVDVQTQNASTSAAPGTVLWQDPQNGMLVAPGSLVVLRIAPARPAATTAATTVSAAKPGSRFVVCIDPGHQAHTNSTQEPYGPGSTKLVNAVNGGATGVTTHLPEYEVALEIAMNLKSRLEKQGVKVVMTRTTNDVNISNSRRAQIANDAHADLFVRVHCDSSNSGSVSGMSMQIPGVDKWTRPIAARSNAAGTDVLNAAVASTGAKYRGLFKRTDLTGFNFAKVPAILIECGFMSNPVEDRLLSSPGYQDKIAGGMTTGIMRYLKGSK